MKKFLFTLTFLVFGVVSYAQEKPQDAEKHVCTEQCDHSGDKEMKACCKAAKAEGKECAHCAKKEAKMEAKACCKAAAAEGKECGKCHPEKGDGKQTAMVEKKSCGKEAAGKSCCSKAATK